MNEPPKHTLPEALELERAQSKEEPPALWCPGMDLPPPPPSCIGQPVPKGVVISQPPNPHQMRLALRPLDPSPTKALQEAHAAIWADIERSTAALDEEKAEATRWWLPFPVPAQAPLPPDLLLLSEAAKEVGYTPRGFTAFLRRYKYPRQYKVISRQGLAELLRKKDDARREYKRNWKKANPAKAVPEPKERAQEKKQTLANEF